MDKEEAEITDGWKEEKMGEENKRKEEISFITPFEKAYPEKLRGIPDAPAGIYVRGKLPACEGLTVAVIGARDCSDYGRYIAEGLGTFLGENGVTVVSGMARGIDGISQRAALQAGGTSVGVLGCGVDICYPAGNRDLFDRLLERGAVLSEYPPGTPPRPMNFPARNRIVSGLADAVVVVEARRKSGTLITVDMALEQGREVFVVPGRVTDQLSDGCNRLIRQGAGVLLTPEELLEELWELKARTGGHTMEHPSEKEEGQGIHPVRKVKSREQNGNRTGSRGAGAMEENSQLSPELQEVYQALDFYPRSVEQIAARLPPGISQRQAALCLIRLCMENKAVQVSPGHFCMQAAAPIRGNPFG